MANWIQISAALLAFGTVHILPAHAESIKASATVSPQSVELARILISSNLSEEAIENGLAQMTAVMFVQQPDLAALEKTYPGMEDKFLATMRPIVYDQIEQIRPLYISDMASLFSANFTNQELQKLSQFWSSPEAQSVLKTALRNMDYAAVSAEVVKQIDTVGDIAISQSAVDQDVQGAMKGAVGDITTSERIAFAKFAMTPEGRKFLTIRDAKRAIDLKWLNAPTSSEVDKRINAAITDAVEKHLAEADKNALKKPDA